MNEEVKACKTCEKRFIVSKGFGKTNGYYRNDCKKCYQAKEKAREDRKRDNEWVNHSYEEGGDICKRCGVKKRMKAHRRLVNKWIVEYFVNGSWTLEKPVCKIE